MGDRIAMATRKEYPPGIIGPISLQSIVTVDLDFVIYDVSLRVPGNPIMATTSPYAKYYYGHTMGVGQDCNGDKGSYGAKKATGHCDLIYRSMASSKRPFLTLIGMS